MNVEAAVGHTLNPWPWIAIVGLIVAVLYFKGYIRLPSRKAPGRPQASPAVVPVRGDSPLDNYDSDALGAAFAKAVRREAEAEIASKFAADAGAKLKERYTAPFSAPPADPSEPAPAG